MYIPEPLKKCSALGSVLSSVSSVKLHFRPRPAQLTSDRPGPPPGLFNAENPLQKSWHADRVLKPHCMA